MSKFDTIIVGSDQVWRPTYMNVETYFLNFTRHLSIKRIAYAASFGVDNWNEFSPAKTKKCSLLAQQFDAISIREDIGVNLCRDYLKVDSIQLLDPTLLFEKEDYISLIEEDIKIKNGTLLCYILDKDKVKDKLIDSISKRLGLSILNNMPSKTIFEKYLDIEECVYPSISKWISGFRDAEFVVTDSFHGTVFSIIFNKPFIALSNVKRGTSRFTSLLKIFGLEDRLYAANTEIDTISLTSIDYAKVNKIKNQWQKKSINFLLKNLSDE